MEPGTTVRLKSGGPLMTVRFTVDIQAAKATGREIGVLCNWIVAGYPQEATFAENQLVVERDGKRRMRGRRGENDQTNVY